MEEVIYLSVRTACAAYILYKVWQAKGPVKRICDALYAVSSSAQAEKKGTPLPEPIPEADVMGGTQSVYLDENTGETGAPFLSLPLEKDFIGEEAEMPEEDVECTLDLERMRLLQEEQEELDAMNIPTEAVSQPITQADLVNMADVLFNRNRTRENEEQSSRAALTLHAIRETEMFAVIEAQVENKEVIEELMGRYLDEEGNPKPVRHGTPPKNESGKDWKTLIA